MSDFVNNFWSLYIAVLTAVSLVSAWRFCRDAQQAQDARSETRVAWPCVGRRSRGIQQSPAALVDRLVLRDDCVWSGVSGAVSGFGSTPVCLHGRRAANTRPKPRLPKVVMARPSIDTWGKGWKLSPRIPKRAQSVNGCF